MDSALALNHVSYTYQAGTAFADRALVDVSLVVPPGSFLMIVGMTGSGKSTLLQQLDALLKPMTGSVKIGRVVVTSRTKKRILPALRRKIGFVFQAPQDQLFGGTVSDDLSFAPRNFGFGPSQIRQAVKWCSQTFSIPTGWLSRSPFDLSGGQMKQVAIAGAFACRPKILLLDEPTAGLDSLESNRVMQLIAALWRRDHLTIVMVTHQMNWVTRYATRVAVMRSGQLVKLTTPFRLFQNWHLMMAAGIRPPFAVRFYQLLKRYHVNLPNCPLNLTELANEIAQVLKTGGDHD